MKAVHVTNENSYALDYLAFKYAFATEYDESKDSAHTIKLLKYAINTELTETQRDYCRLYYYEGMTMEEIAVLRERNKSTVSRTIKRARNRLRKVIKYTNPKYLKQLRG